ncbi:unnamed protein product [Cyprideis torosa]|uniref:Uncharacterized protein n=1 Tax=Cyprideis torosa TaxID=163714 RepID=A0A7R8W4E3_9CRUS|nr:unnamed protein product [Cyprideis torosa]CAG0884125.1 unnamed protein product [Cyprideis torosa]
MHAPRIYDLSLCENDERFSTLSRFHESTFGCKPEFIVFAPGRVNLIGEHVDYSGYSVLPMAIRQAVLLGISAQRGVELEFHFRNIDDVKYPGKKVAVSNLVIDPCNRKWHDYLICGIRAILEEFKFVEPSQAFDCSVLSDIPPAAGLSSSSALVCAAALATLYFYKHKASKLTLSKLCASGERWVGTEGGGMDQAICFLGEEGQAQWIEFDPLKCTPVVLPEGATFVVAHSRVEIEKATTVIYNTRVVECRLASLVLAHAQKLELPYIRTLLDVEKKLGWGLSAMKALVKEVLHEHPYTKAEICSILHLTEEQVDVLYLNREVREAGIKEFKLYQRALHVYQEADRVLSFFTACELVEGAVVEPKAVLERLGKLMSASHVSCRDLYECSHPQLDNLVRLLKPFSYGARMTGAGWGGCVVALVKKDQVDACFMELKETFYDGNQALFDRLVFVSPPSKGACIYT